MNPNSEIQLTLMESSSPDPDEIGITIDGPYAYLPLHAAAALQKTFEYQSRKSIAFAAAPLKFLQPVSGIQLRTYRGLVPRIAACLTAQGYNTEIYWQNTPSAHVDAQFVDRFRNDEEARLFLQQVTALPFGRIDVGGLVEAAPRIALLRLAFPNLNFLIGAKNRHNAELLREHLQDRVEGFSVQQLNSIDWRAKPLTAIGCNRSFRSALTNHDDWQIIIFTDLQTAMAKYEQYEFEALGHNRLVYGIFRQPNRLHPYDELRLEAVLGPIVYPVEQPTEIIEIPFVDPAFQKPFWQRRSASNDLLQRKRTLIWENAARNRFIAQLSLALSSGSVVELIKDLEPRSALLADWSRRWDSCPTVAILVESPTHGRALQALLPDWPLLAETGQIDPLRPYDNCIATTLWTQRHELVTDVTIHADGTSQEPRNRVRHRTALVIRTVNSDG